MYHDAFEIVFQHMPLNIHTIVFRIFMTKRLKHWKETSQFVVVYTIATATRLLGCVFNWSQIKVIVSHVLVKMMYNFLYYGGIGCCGEYWKKKYVITFLESRTEYGCKNFYFTSKIVGTPIDSTLYLIITCKISWSWGNRASFNCLACIMSQYWLN